MLKVVGLLVMGLVMVIRTSEALECPQQIPCNRGPCTPPPECSYGVGMGVCGCCPECLKGPGEECGGWLWEFGTCDEDYTCKLQNPKWSGSKGVCVPSTGDNESREKRLTHEDIPEQETELETSDALECPQQILCNLKCHHCTREGCGEAPECKFGVGMGVCRCCPECLKGPGEECGGTNYELGTCDEGYTCKLQNPKWSNSKGVCVSSQTKGPGEECGGRNYEFGTCDEDYTCKLQNPKWSGSKGICVPSTGDNEPREKRLTHGDISEERKQELRKWGVNI